MSYDVSAQPPAKRPAPGSTTAQPDQQPRKPPARLVSLDAYRGLIMLTLAGAGFGIATMAKEHRDDPFWQRLAFHFTHPDWVSAFPVNVAGYDIPLAVSYWDLIQPAFIFMVGVALPFSVSRRATFDHSRLAMWGHVLFRSLALILLGVFLKSAGNSPPTRTIWVFTNVLSQIGLAYPFAYLFVGRRAALILLVVALLLAGVWVAFAMYPPPGPDTNWELYDLEANVLEEMPGPWAHWIKGTNVFAAADVEILNRLPRVEPFQFQTGGYTTLNFIPSIATMLLGVVCGQWLLRDGSGIRKALLLIALAVVLLAAGAALGATVSPVVKRLWSPSFALLTGGYVVVGLALFYLVIDVLGLKFWTMPLVVIGRNSLLIYLFGQLLTKWTAGQLKVHFGAHIFDGYYGPIYQSVAVLFVFWLVLFWLHRQKAYLRL